MRTLRNEPGNWIELQDLVAKLFQESGYAVEIEKTVPNARGQAEIDVFVNPRHDFFRSIICECKYWDRDIPQSVVHGVRQVVGDTGSSLGLIISKRGFQSGAVEAARYSNVMLISWPDFVMRIHDAWVKGRLSLIVKECYPLFIYFDPLDVPTHLLSSEEKERYRVAFKKYYSVVALCHKIMLNIIGRSGFNDAYIGCEGESLPELFKRHVSENNINAAFESAEEYFDFIQDGISQALVEITPLFQDKDMEDTPIESVEDYAKLLLGEVECKDMGE